eukprot:Em0020g903a
MAQHLDVPSSSPAPADLQSAALPRQEEMSIKTRTMTLKKRIIKLVSKRKKGLPNLSLSNSKRPRSKTVRKILDTELLGEDQQTGAPQLNEPSPQDPLPAPTKVTWLDIPLDHDQLSSVLRPLLRRMTAASSLFTDARYTAMQEYLTKVAEHLGVAVLQEQEEEKILWKLTCKVTGVEHQSTKVKQEANLYCRFGVLWKTTWDAMQQQDLNSAQQQDSIRFSALLSQNETVEFLLGDLEHNILGIEVWGSNKKRSSSINGRHLSIGSNDPTQSIQSIQSLIDDSRPLMAPLFIGRASCTFQDILLGTTERELVLFSHTKRHERGKVSIQLSIAVPQSNASIQETLVGYEALFKAIVRHESQIEGNGCPVRMWSAQLPPLARDLLHAHATWHHADVLQTSVVELGLLVDYHRRYGVKMVAFMSLLDQVKEAMVNTDGEQAQMVTPAGSKEKTSCKTSGFDSAQSTTSSPQSDPASPSSAASEVMSPFSGEPLPLSITSARRSRQISESSQAIIKEEEMARKHDPYLSQVFKELACCIEDNLRQHLSVFDITKPEEIEECLKVLQTLHTLHPFVEQLSSKINFQTTIEDCIKNGVQNWFSVCNTELRPGRQYKATSLKALSEACCAKCREVKEHIVDIFKRFHVDYLSIFIQVIGTRVVREMDKSCTPFSGCDANMFLHQMVSSGSPRIGPTLSRRWIKKQVPVVTQKMEIRRVGQLSADRSLEVLAVNMEQIIEQKIQSFMEQICEKLKPEISQCISQERPIEAFLNTLQNRLLSTQSLIAKCCAVLAGQQELAKTSNTTRGEVFISVGYTTDMTVELNVIKAKSTRHTKMASDIFVYIWILPQLTFTECAKKKYKTDLVKGTLEPNFCKEFIMVGSSLQLPSSHSWFVHLVPEWLRIALVRCKDGISRAVEFDGVVNSKKDVCFSSSLVETMTYLQQMVEFWKELNWPFPIDACGFMITLVKNISDAAMYYVEEVFARNRDSSECAKMSGGAADQLCLILNDMQHIQTTLSPPQLEGGGGASGGGDGVGGGGGAKVTSIFEDLQLEGFFSWIETEKGLGQRARSQVRDTVESTVLAIQNKIHVATEKLAQQLPTVAKFVNKMLDAEESVSPEMALHPLADYLTANLQLLSSRLLYIVFWQLLRQLWSTVVTVLCNKTCSLASSSESHVYQRMQHAALALRDIFHAGGEGLSVAELESQQYKALLGDLELMCLSPPELVLKCCEDLVEQQAMATSLTEHRLGELALSIRYLRDKGTLEVTIVLAQNLPGLNKNGFSDPYVEIMLMPATYFEVVNRGVKTPSKEETSTSLQSDTVTPCSRGTARQSWHNPGLRRTQEGSEQPLGQPKSFLLPLFHVSESKVFQKLALRSEHSYHQEPLEFLKLLNKKCRPRSSPRLMSRLGAMTFTRHVS